MKIAIVTDDGITISQHFGRAAYYEVLTLEDGKVTSRERREKPAHGDHHHHPHHGEETVLLHDASAVDVRSAEVGSGEVGNTHGPMVAPIRDCQVMIGRGMGRPAYDSLRGAGIEPILTEVREINEAVRQCLNGELADHPERLH